MELTASTCSFCILPFSFLSFLSSETTFVSHWLLWCPLPVPLTCSHLLYLSDSVTTTCHACFYSPGSHYFYGPGFPAESQAVLLSVFRRLFSSARVPVDRLHLPILLPGSAHSFFFSLIHFSRRPLPSSGYKYSPCVDNSHADISTIDFSPELGYLIDFSKLSRPERNL